MSKARIIIFILFSTIGVLMVIYVLMINHLSIQGPVYKRVALQVDALQREDLVIEEQILEASAYSTIRRKALEQGYINSTEIHL